jgi:hypothetical protein
MNRFENMFRFEELSAGLAMGDLSMDEERELGGLGAELGVMPDIDFEWLATTLEIESLRANADPMPAHLVARLEKCADQLADPAGGDVIITPQVSAWQRVLRSPLTGWAVAAAITLMAWVGSKSDSPANPSLASSQLRSKAGDLIERDFQGLGEFSSASGNVIWSDQLQQGYMTLSGIPVNNPGKAQYQLWIVDPKRDEAPVDGGVFDIPTDGSPVVVPIVAKLALTNPQAFVITLEQPGGVVKSKQEKVVALAKL